MAKRLGMDSQFWRDYRDREAYRKAHKLESQIVQGLLADQEQTEPGLGLSTPFLDVLPGSGTALKGLLGAAPIAVGAVKKAVRCLDSPEWVEAVLKKRRGKTKEEVKIQGGPLDSKLNEQEVAQILDEHGMDWRYHDNGGVSVKDYYTKNGRLGFKWKHFRDGTRLRTIRNWLNY